MSVTFRYQALSLLQITLYFVLCDFGRSPAGSYSLSGSAARSSTNHDGDTSSQDESERGRMLFSAVLDRPNIPDYTVRSRLTDIRGDSTTYLRNFDFSNVQIGTSARLTPLDDVTAELVTTDLSLNIRADWEAIVTSVFFSLSDAGTIAYQVEPTALNIIYNYHEGPPAKFTQRSCVGNLVFSPPSITANKGDSWMYTIVMNEIRDDVQEEVTAKICALFDPEVNGIIARNLQPFTDMFQQNCPLVPHAIFIDCPRTPNSACAVSCEDGYVTSSSLVLDSIIFCTRSGSWNTPEESVCEAASCETSTDACADEGEICIDETLSGFHCQCDVGYVRNSEDTSCIVSEDMLEFVTRPADVTVEEGELVLLACEVNSDDASRFWFKGTRQLLSVDVEEGVYVTSASLIFISTELKHAGNYTCVARSPRGHEIRASALINIASQSIPTNADDLSEPVFIRRPEDTELSLGGLVLFHCEVDVTNTDVNWYKDDTLIAHGGSPGIILLRDNSLVIVDTEVYHQGTYRCVVTTLDGRRGEATARAYFPTSYIFDAFPSDGTVFDGENYHLTCSSNIPTLELSWLKDGSQLVYSERIFKLGDDVLLRDVTADDSGIYVCVATDDEGNLIAEASSRVDVFSHNLNDDDCGIVTSSEVLVEANSRGAQSGRVVGGRDAERGSAPWMARLYINGPSGRGHICGGSLIDRQWVVTAAHCFYVTDNLLAEHLFIRLGDHDTLNDDPAEISVRVEAVYKHEHFDKDTYENDIALVKLVTPLSRYTDYIRPICLANRTIDKELLVSNNPGRVNGWGATTEGGAGSVYLQEVYLQFKPYRTCKRSFSDMGVRFTKTMFCAGYKRGGADACQGDSGGPYTNEKADRWYLTGIVSWGIGCGQAGSNGVYTRYSKYHEWLQEIINES